MPVAFIIPTRPLPSLDKPTPLSLTDINFSLKLHSAKSKLSEFKDTSFANSMFIAWSSPLRAFPKIKHPFLEAWPCKSM